MSTYLKSNIVRDDYSNSHKGEVHLKNDDFSQLYAKRHDETFLVAFDIDYKGESFFFDADACRHAARFFNRLANILEGKHYD